MSWHTRTRLPTTSTLLLSQVTPDVRNQLIHKRQVAKQYYDRGTKQLPELVIGQPVRIPQCQMTPAPSSQWSTGVCLGQVGPQSYEVQTKDRILRRNRQMIRDAPDTKTTDIVPYFTAAVPADTRPVPSVAPSATDPIPTVQVYTRLAPVASSHSGGTTSDPPALSKSDNITEAPPVTTTRAGRLIRLPSRYKD